MHTVVVGVLFMMVVMFAVVAVGSWVLVAIVRGVGRMLGGSGRPAPRPGARMAGVIRCRQPGCQADNPAHSRFCRRCGQPL